MNKKTVHTLTDHLNNTNVDMCKLYESIQQDEEYIEQYIENPLKTCEDSNIADDEDEFDFSIDEFDKTRDRANSASEKILELEEELEVVGHSLMSLKLSEEKANKRVEEFKQQLGELAEKLKEAEARTEITVKKLHEDFNKLEVELSSNQEFLADETDSLSELASY